MARRIKGSGALYEDAKTGVWIGEVVIDGRRRRVKARAKVDASAKLARLIADADAGIVRPDGNATTKGLIDLWRNRVLANRELAPSSRENYERALRVLDEEFGKVRLRNLDVDRIERGLDAIASGRYGRDNPLSRRSLKLMRGTLVQVLDLGVKRRLIPGNPAQHAELTPTAKRGTPRSGMTVADALALWRVLDDDRLGAAFKLMMTTTMRPGEALGLCFDCIDLDSGELTLRRAVQLDGGTARLVEGKRNLKTVNAERRLIVPAPALEALRTQRRRVAAMKLSTRYWPDPDPGLVFPTTSGRPWNPANARRELAALCATAGIATFTPGQLRHTAKAILDDENIEPVIIRNLMGHSTEWMQDHYGHRAGKPVDGHVAAMEKVFGS